MNSFYIQMHQRLLYPFTLMSKYCEKVQIYFALSSCVLKFIVTGVFLEVYTSGYFNVYSSLTSNIEFTLNYVSF